MKSNAGRLELIKAAAERRRQMNYELMGILSLDVLRDEPIPAGSYLVHNHVRPQKKAHGAIPSHHVHHVIESVASHTRSKMTRFASKRYYALAEYVSHRPGMPLSSCDPRSENFNPAPATRSVTTLETKTSLGWHCAITRAAAWTAGLSPQHPGIRCDTPSCRRAGSRTSGDDGIRLADRRHRGGTSMRSGAIARLFSRPETGR